jgi:predicted N-formylglutamate amidohydrolase
MKCFLSCEHGGNQVPDQYQALFEGAQTVLDSHRGYDKGALELFEALRLAGVHYNVFSTTTRLLVDLNRSLHRRSLFSEYTRNLSNTEKQLILEHYYYPFRNAFMHEALSVVRQDESVFHVSVHSFTPVLNGEARNADIGLLYNPGHGIEKLIAISWKERLQKLLPRFVIRYNYPYLGKTDGHVASLRKALGNQYAGIEFELNNKHAGNNEVYNAIALTYKEILADDLFVGTFKTL